MQFITTNKHDMKHTAIAWTTNLDNKTKQNTSVQAQVVTHKHIYCAFLWTFPYKHICVASASVIPQQHHHTSQASWTSPKDNGTFHPQSGVLLLPSCLHQMCQVWAISDWQSFLLYVCPVWCNCAKIHAVYIDCLTNFIQCFISYCQLYWCTFSTKR